MEASFSSTPDRAGKQAIRNGRVQLYYEVRGTGNPEKLILLNGAFATLKHYEQLAHKIAATGRYEVMTFDYRGYGKSTVDRTTKFAGADGKQTTEPRSQTSELLAEDAVELIDAIWGKEAKVHVYGASMGGFIAEKLALLLIPENRLLSLYLAVTARGQAPRMPFLGAGFYKLMMPMLVKSDPKAMVASLVPQCFSAEYLDAVGADGKTNRELWTDRWTREYNDWYGFSDKEASASQCSVVGKHWFTDAEAATIKASKVPVFVRIALDDALMKPKAQQELAALLNAEKVETKGGHMGNPAAFQDFVNELIGFYDKAATARA